MRVQIVKEVMDGDSKDKKFPKLCFQWCNYIYDDGSIESGYRFIWRRGAGTLQPARGQARIPSIALAEKLIKKAKDEGWGNNAG